MKIKIFIISLLILLCSNHNFAQVTSPEYKILNKFHLEGDGSWDYLSVDDSASRLYISHGTMVQVFDLAAQKLIGTIPDTKGVHGIALARDLNKGFISNGKDSSVTIFNLKTLEVITKINVTGKNPDAILYDQFSHKVFVYNGRSANATVIDANTNVVIGTITLSGKPEFSVTDGKGKIYVNIEDKSQVCVINPVTLKVEQTWSLTPGEEPSGLALDLINHRLFSVCGNKLMIVMNSDNGKIIAKLDIGDRVDGVAFDPSLKRAYSSNGDGTLTIVQEENENTFKVLENFNTQKGARTIALNPKTHYLYLPAADYGETPEPTKDNPHPRPSIVPGTFVILEIKGNN
jgi:YVTN family beta-propeller protein